MTDEKVDPTTGEIIAGPIAADGGRTYPAAHTLADFIRMMENGQFDADVAQALHELAADLENMAIASGGGTLKADLTIKIGIKREHGGLYKFTSDFAIKRPKETRPQSVGWVTPENKFTPNMPRQGVMFGTVRDVSTERTIAG